MIGRLLSGATPWLMAAGLAAVVGGYAYVNALHGQLEHVRSEQARTQTALDMTTAALAVQTERNRALVVSLEDREQQLNQGARRVQSLRTQATALGADDADDLSKAWADQRLPGSVSEWVRGLAEPSGDDANSERDTQVPD